MGNYKTDKINARFYALKLNRNTDADIIQQLDNQGNKQAYLKSLIREDISRTEHKTVTNDAGTKVNYEAAVILMDDDIREELAAEGYETEQEFFSAYEKAHAAKYGEPWELSKANPTY